MPLLDKLREQYGLGPVCSELHIAPSRYCHCQQQRHHPDKRSARAQRDDWLKREIQRVYDENHQVYGVRKVWCQRQFAIFMPAKILSLLILSTFHEPVHRFV